jgi:hypothetical protein
MSSDLSTVEKSIKEILIDLMAEKVLSIGVQPHRQRSASIPIDCTSIWAIPNCDREEKQASHDLENAKLIPSILPDYIPPLAGTVSRDSVPRDFDYTLITAYLPKGIRIVGL